MSILTQILPKKESTSYFIVLALEERHARAAVAEITGDKVKILGVGKSEYNDEEQEIEAVDIAISTAEKSIPETLLIENVIFALPQLYVEGDNVKPEYLGRLKKIAKELELKAYGFVDYASAVANFLGASEGSPPTVILMDISKNHVTLTLVRIGKIHQNVIVGRSDSIVADFTKALPSFETEILPSRIVIFDFAEKTEELKEELLKFPWHKHSIFLHTPKMEVFENELILKAIVEAAATSFLPNIAVPPDEKEETAEKTETVREKIEEINDENVEKHKKEPAKKFGFQHESISDEPIVHKKETTPVFKKPKIDISGIMEKIKNIIPKELPNFGFGRFLILIPVFALAVLFFFLVKYYPAASISLIAYPQKSDQTLDIVFIKEDTSDGDNSIQTRTVSEEVEGSKTIKTTGTNQIGEKAKGEVTVYNKQTSLKNLPKGAILSSGPIKFTLDSDIKIASASEGTEGITFGKISVKVTAQAIGPESNLPAQSNFVFKDFSDSAVSAKNLQSISGGTSRDIDSVSKEDRDNLEDLLNKELISTGKQKLLKKLNTRGRLLDSPITTVVSAKKFSGEIGTEAKELSLDMTLQVAGLEFNQDDLEKLANNQNIAAPSGFKLDPGKVTVKVENSTTDKNGNIRADVILSSYFTPDFDTEKIKNEIKGKSYNDAIAYLEKVEKVGGVRITPEKTLPFFGKRLPYNAKNINIVLASI